MVFYSLVDTNKHFRGTCSLHLQSQGLTFPMCINYNVKNSVTTDNKHNFHTNRRSHLPRVKYTANTHPENITLHYTHATHHPICFVPHR